MPTGGAEEPFHSDRHGPGRIGYRSRVTSVANNRADPGTTWTRRRSGNDNLGKLRGVLLDVLTKIHHNDHGTAEAQSAWTAG